MQRVIKVLTRCTGCPKKTHFHNHHPESWHLRENRFKTFWIWSLWGVSLQGDDSESAVFFGHPVYAWSVLVRAGYTGYITVSLLFVYSIWRLPSYRNILMTRGCCRNVPDKGNKEGTRADCLPATIPTLLLTYPDLLARVISQTRETQKHALCPRFVKRHDL